MQTIYEGDEFTTVIRFLDENGEPQVASSLTVKVRGHTGTILFTSTPTVTGLTELAYTVSSSHSTLGSGKRWENRYFEAEYVIGGTHHRVRFAYRVSQFLTHTVTEQMVRGAMGLSIYELPNDEIDIGEAYFLVEAAVTQDVLEAALGATDTTNIHANQAIALRAALKCIPSLRLRALQRKGDDNIEASRFEKMDWDQLLADLSGQYGDAIVGLTGGTVDPTTPTLMVLATPTDAITGA